MKVQPAMKLFSSGLEDSSFEKGRHMPCLSSPSLGGFIRCWELVLTGPARMILHDSSWSAMVPYTGPTGTTAVRTS